MKIVQKSQEFQVCNFNRSWFFFLFSIINVKKIIVTRKLENYFTWENLEGVKYVKHEYKLILKNNKLSNAFLFYN